MGRIMYYIKHRFWQANISMFKIEKQNKIELAINKIILLLFKQNCKVPIIQLL